MDMFESVIEKIEKVFGEESELKTFVEILMKRYYELLNRPFPTEKEIGRRLEVLWIMSEIRTEMLERQGVI